MAKVQHRMIQTCSDYCGQVVGIFYDDSDWHCSDCEAKWEGCSLKCHLQLWGWEMVQRQWFKCDKERHWFLLLVLSLCIFTLLDGVAWYCFQWVGLQNDLPFLKIHSWILRHPSPQLVSAQEISHHLMSFGGDGVCQIILGEMMRVNWGCRSLGAEQLT